MAHDTHVRYYDLDPTAISRRCSPPRRSPCLDTSAFTWYVPRTPDGFYLSSGGFSSYRRVDVHLAV